MREMRQLRVWLPKLGAVILLSFSQPSLSHAQTMSEYQVKAAYLYNFGKFVEWPKGAFASSTAALQLCVLNDRAFESELTQLVKGKTIAGRPAEVVSVRNGEESRSCHILFINSSHARDARQVLEALRETSVLTVGEMQGFVEAGGIINFVLQDDRVRFQVNHRAAIHAGLQISSRLLSVATGVIE